LFVGHVRKGKLIRRSVKSFVGALLLVGGFVGLTNMAVLASARANVFDSTDRVPAEPVALVLGSAPYLNGVKNPFLEHRLDAAAELYRKGKVAKVLASGDNSTKAYDEPTAMKAGLVERGVPEAAIVLDYAGFRTLDSVVRAHRIFGVDHCIIVTDDFHIARALYIAQKEGLDAIGLQSAPVPSSVSPWTGVREIGARTQAWIDLVVLHKSPRLLGRREAI
jgi:SanA protein